MGTTEHVSPSENQPSLARAGFNIADLFSAQERHRRLCIALRHNRHHADAHVKNLIHFRRIDISISLQDLEDVRNTPTPCLDDGVALFRKDARQIINQTAARDVGKALIMPLGTFVSSG